MIWRAALAQLPAYLFLREILTSSCDTGRPWFRLWPVVSVPAAALLLLCYRWAASTCCGEHNTTHHVRSPASPDDNTLYNTV